MEEVQDIKHEFKELFKCGICLDILELPKALPCQHIFCKICLQRVFLLESKVICPLCRDSNFVITELEEIDKLSTNFYVKQSVEILKKRQSQCSGNSKESYETQYKVDDEISNLKGKEDCQDFAKGLENISINEGDEHDDCCCTCSDIESSSDEEQFDRAALENALQTRKKKSKGAKLLKFLNRKLYGSYEGELTHTKNTIYNTTCNKPLNQQEKPKEKTVVTDNKRQKYNSSFQRNLMLTMAGNRMGLLARHNPKSYYRPKQGNSLQGYGYSFANKQTASSSTKRKQKLTRSSSESDNNNHNPLFRSPFPRTCSRGKKKKSVIFLLK